MLTSKITARYDQGPGHVITQLMAFYANILAGFYTDIDNCEDEDLLVRFNMRLHAASVRLTLSARLTANSASQSQIPFPMSNAFRQNTSSDVVFKGNLGRNFEDVGGALLAIMLDELQTIPLFFASRM